MSLEDKLEAMRKYPAADDVTYTPRTEFDGGQGFIQTGPMTAQPDDYVAILKEFGYDPKRVRIVGHPKVSRWQQRARIRGTSEYETSWLCAYRFTIADVAGHADTSDIDRIVKAARKAPKRGTPGHWFVFQAGDLQIGKRSRDGSTDQILQRYFESVESAVAEFKTLKRLGIEGIQISMPGDLCEGNQSQGQRNLWLTAETITEQGRILRRIMMHTVEAFAPLVDKVTLDVVNGNHDQAQRSQNTFPGDGWATEAAIAVSDALGLNPSCYNHVDVRVPEQWSGSMTVPVGDSIVTVIHGHQWRPNAGMRWWSEQALHHQPAGASHVLQSGHYHSWHVETTENRTWIQSSTYDCGSDWYRDTKGATARRGGLTYLLAAGQVSRMSLL